MPGECQEQPTDQPATESPEEELIWYLGGPMSGYEDFNFPAFERAAKACREDHNMKVISAHEIDHGIHTGSGTQPWVNYMRGDLAELLKCDGAIFLQGWPDSKGARLEFEIALDLGYPIFQFVESGLGNMLIGLRKREFYNV